MNKIEVETVDCGRSDEVGKKLVALIFKREKLIYDIRNCCFIEGSVMTDSPDEVRSKVQDVGDDGNVDRVTRVLDLVHADIVERLYPFTKREIDNPVIDDLLHEKPVYGIVLNVPETFSQSTLNLLGKLIHELLVYSAVTDWMSITNPKKEETWRRKAEAIMKRVNEVKNFRREKVRIKPHWLG